MNKELIDDFKVKEMKKFWVKPYGDEEVIKTAIANAYNDMQPRTIPGHGKFKNPKEKTVEWLFERISLYINKPKNNQHIFDSWMQKVCSDYVQFYNVSFETDIKFGKAQKLFNMTFKYLFCMWGTERPDAFKYCHMALDSYILDWYRREIDRTQKTSWSNLNASEYFEIAENIAKAINGLPIEEEFGIWQDEKDNRRKKELLNKLRIKPTKGYSAIVNELCARFSLDYMPGIQMRIDAELNEGILDKIEAKEQRECLRDLGRLLSELQDIIN